MTIIGSPISSTAPIPSNSRRYMREQLARTLFDLVEGTATATGTTTTLIDSALTRYANDYFVGAELYLLAADATAWITDSAQATGTLTYTPATTATTAGMDYQIYRQVRKAAIDRALARAAAGCIVQTSLTPNPNSLDYYLMSSIGLSRPNQVLAVWLRACGDVRVTPQRLTSWHIEDAEGALTLRVPYLLQAGDQLWLEYHADEHWLISDLQAINLPSGLIIARAAVLLCEEVLARQDAGGRDVWAVHLKYWREVEQVENARHTPPARFAVAPNYDAVERGTRGHPLWSRL